MSIAENQALIFYYTETSPTKGIFLQQIMTNIIPTGQLIKLL